MGIERYGIYNDIHFPFHDRQRYEISLKILRSLKPAHIYLNGDIGEFQGVSSHPIHPKEKRINFLEEIEFLNKKFDELQELFPDVPVTYICGNHEYRLFRYIRDVAPHLWGVMSECPALLKFNERPKWKFVDYGPEQLVKCGASGLYLRHEPIGSGASHAKTTAEKSYIDIAYGHTHQHQSYTHVKFGPKKTRNKAYSLGWLGDPTRHVFDYRGSKDNWCRGFTIVECETKTGEYNLDFINLEKLPVFYRGEMYELRKR